MIESLFARQRFDVGCTVDIEHTFDSLHAYVELDGDIEIEPGDEVIVHGHDVDVPYGEALTLRRTATVIRATWPERQWTRLTGRLEFMDLLEFSFSSGSRL